MTLDAAAYNVHEDVGTIQLTLGLSNPSSLLETVQVISVDINATGTEY